MYSDLTFANGLPRPFRRAPGERLRDAVLALAQGKARLVRHSENSWASITFAGARHRLTLQFAGSEAVQAGENFIAFLPEHEFALPGQLVADAAVTEVDHHLEPPLLVITCEVLVVEEG
ncbi:conserved hypothetical protein [Altererythrobacter sp. B11]|uniref:hypothetical protein n=1 Tax=Altererythrobacter sp. B11 TaxID=2060312 RepID=UPI000DC72096|nr:hypothetical protein [Altererythrobacter sp. B11]BBC73701.1 conserved hypothetical protein [Altererythrobacter sp. B11]